MKYYVKLANETHAEVCNHYDHFHYDVFVELLSKKLILLCADQVPVEYQQQILKLLCDSPS